MANEINKQHVYKEYEKIHEWYEQSRTKTLFERDYLELVSEKLNTNDSVLDLGCGTGEPIAQYFIDHGYQVTGVDASSKMLQYAQQRYPDHTWLLTDMRHCELNTTFNAIIAWDSFFHLPKQDQCNMFRIFAKHSKKNTRLLFTAGPRDGEVVSKMDGERFYHASLDESEYADLLLKNGFKMLLFNKEDPNCNEHTVCLAEYK